MLWRHENLRIAYIAQHSVEHVEEFLDMTPIDYMQVCVRYLLWPFVDKAHLVHYKA